MTQYIHGNDVNGNTLGEVIKNGFADFAVVGGKAPMDMDTTHGVEIETADNSKYGHGITVWIYPFVEWSDGSHRPCHYWGMEYYIMLEKR